MSAAPNQSAIDGVFAPHFVAAILNPDLSISDLFIQVRKAVLKESNNRQIPYSTDLQADHQFYFSDPSGDGSRQLSQAKILYGTGQYKQALQLFRVEAARGSAESLRYLGEMYDYGRGGLKEDDVQAVKLYKEAAAEGDARAMSDLGYKYECGCGGLAQDDAEAVRWYQRAVEKGDGQGMMLLGHMNEYGRGGLKQNDVEAVKWYRNSAEAGDASGMRHLGFMYESGRGGFKQDDVEAV
jgi:hypothetical protein